MASATNVQARKTASAKQFLRQPVEKALEQENRELKLELAKMTSPDRLEALARQRLGLVTPEKGQVVVLP